MIKEAFVSFEVANLLKEKGFDEPCIATYNSTTKNFQVEEIYEDWTIHWKGYISAPTHQMAMTWLREEKRIFIRIIEDCTGEVFRYEIYNHTPDNNGNYYISNTYVDSYEDAVEVALKYCLENLI